MSSMTLEGFYRTMPIGIQHSLCTAQGVVTRLRRYNGDFRTRLREANARGSWPDEEVRAYQREHLLRWAQHAATTVPYYQSLLAQRGVEAGDIKTLEDFESAFPILEKSEVQTNAEAFVSHAVRKRNCRVVHTSGTTGAGLRFLTTWPALREQWAIWWRYWGWHGIKLGTPCGWFAGRSIVSTEQDRPPFWRYNLVGKQFLFSAYHTAPEQLDAYVGELRRRQLPWLHGYPSLLALIATHIVERGADLGYQIEHVTVGAENLLPHQVSVMESAFGVRPRQHYGLAEGVANASECEQGALHIDEDYAYTELVPDPVSGNHVIVGSNFSNPAFPLLRYKTSDLVQRLAQPCSCGRPGRTLGQIDGRQEDEVVLPNGARLGSVDLIFKGFVWTREAQIYQPRVGEVVIRVVPSPSYSSDDERRLLDAAVLQLGRDTTISVEYWDALPRTSTGKLRQVVSEVT